VGLDVRAHPLRGTLQAATLGRQHLHQLASPRQQGTQGLRRGSGQWSRGGPHRLRHVRQALGLQGVRLGQPPGRFGKLPGMAGIHHHDGQTGISQGPGHRHRQPARGLQDDPGGLARLQPRDQAGDP
jgi:hypothetical protein